MSAYNIYVPTENGKIKIDCSKILYLETSLQFTRATLADNETIEILLTINEIEQLLSDQGFFRFNNNAIVNLKFVQIVFPSDASKVILENGKEIFVNYNKKDELFEHLRQVYDLYELV